LASLRNTIRFVCSNCIAPLAAKRRHAGAKMRCPRCHTILVVPQESRPRAAPEVYPLADQAQGAPPAAPTVSFLCSLCKTRMDAPADQAGRTVTCPDCGTPAVVPALAASALPSGDAPAPPASAGPVEVYNVLEGQDQPPPTATEVYRRYIPVVCALCRTRMHAAEDQVGQTMVCPDCGTANVVPPIAVSEARAPLAPMQGYELAAEDSSRPQSRQKRPEFTFKCPVCSTRLQASRGEAGKTMACPDCGTDFAIPLPPADEPRWDPFEEPVEVYAVAGGPPPASTPIPFAAWHDSRAPGLPDGEDLLQDDRDLLPPRRSARKLPPWPLVNGVFSFPFQRSSLVCWGKMAVGAMLVQGGAALVLTQVQAIDQTGVGLGYLAMAAGMLYTMGFVCILAVFFSLWISSSALKIVTETANGADRIEEWASEDFVDWAFEALYLVNSVVLSLLVGWGVQALAPRLPPDVTVIGSLFLLFPVILLSMLETGSAMNPISPALLKSLFLQWWAWLGFYVLAAMLLVAVAGVVLGLWLGIGFWSAFPASLAIAPALMIYFRLLGRLGWYITVRSRAPERDTAE